MNAKQKLRYLPKFTEKKKKLNVIIAKKQCLKNLNCLKLWKFFSNGRNPASYLSNSISGRGVCA